MNSLLFAELLEEILKLLALFGKGMAMAFAGKRRPFLNYLRRAGKGKRY
jgi:hypothetical protein